MFELKPLSAAVQRAQSTAAIAATVVAPTTGQAADNPVEAVGEVIKGVVSIPGKIVEGIFGGKGDEEIEEVTITGSRIKTDANIFTTSPVTTLEAFDLKNRGAPGHRGQPIEV